MIYKLQKIKEKCTKINSNVYINIIVKLFMKIKCLNINCANIQFHIEML
jgi:hypothetical protein